MYSGVPAAAGLVKRGKARGEGTGSRSRNGLARPVNSHGRSCGCLAAVAAKDLLPPLDLGPALFEGCTIGVQMLDKYRILLEESGQTSLQDGHERWLWHGFLHLVDHGREVILEIRKTPLTFKYEPLDIGLYLRSKTVQVCLLHHVIAVTGA